jgi:hypothetical protein
MSLKLKIAVIEFAEACVGIEPSKKNASTVFPTDDDLVERLERAAERARALYDLTPSETKIDADIQDAEKAYRSPVSHFGGKSD